VCTHSFGPFQQRAQKISVLHHAVHAFCFRVLKLFLLLLHFASSVHSFLLPSAPKIWPRVPGSGPCSRRLFSGEEAGGSVTLLSSLIGASNSGSRSALCSEGDGEEMGGEGGKRAEHARPPPPPKHLPRRRHAAPPPPPPAAHHR
jgi:hypothetical protein